MLTLLLQSDLRFEFDRKNDLQDCCNPKGCSQLEVTYKRLKFLDATSKVYNKKLDFRNHLHTAENHHPK